MDQREGGESGRALVSMCKIGRNGGEDSVSENLKEAVGEGFGPLGGWNGERCCAKMLR